MAFSNPIVGSGDGLIRQAIQSPNFVTGVSGWRIAKDGSAEFADATIRGVITVPGDTPPAALILDTLGDGLPYILFRGEDGDEWALTGTSDVGGTAQFALTGPTHCPRIDVVEDQGLYISSDGTNGTQSVGVWMEGRDSGIFTTQPGPGFLKRFGPAGFADIQDWNAVSYQNGWNAPGGGYADVNYKLFPDGLVHLRGVMDVGTTANGTVCFNLPAGYRPKAGHEIFYCGNADGTNPGSHLQVKTTGDVSIFGHGGAGSVSVSGIKFSVI